MEPRIHIADNITGSQVRAARALLGWDRQHCAELCGIGLATLARIERGSTPQERTLADIARVFDGAGIVFFDDERGMGVAIRR